MTAPRTVSLPTAAVRALFGLTYHNAQELARTEPDALPRVLAAAAHELERALASDRDEPIADAALAAAFLALALDPKTPPAVVDTASSFFVSRCFQKDDETIPARLRSQARGLLETLPPPAPVPVALSARALEALLRPVPASVKRLAASAPAVLPDVLALALELFRHSTEPDTIRSAAALLAHLALAMDTATDRAAAFLSADLDCTFHPEPASALAAACQLFAALTSPPPRSSS